MKSDNNLEETQPKTPKKYVEKNPKKLALKGQKDREIYLEWASIPAMLRMLPAPELEKMGYNVDDPIFMKLVSIKRKGELCREFGFSPDMPSTWEKDPNFLTEVNQLAQKSHVMKFRKDVDFAFTQKVLRHGDAARMKLWKQLNEGWSERTESVNVNLNMTPADLVAEIEARNARIREAK
jgi:hypothetical protein